MGIGQVPASPVGGAVRQRAGDRDPRARSGAGPSTSPLQAS